MSVLAPPAGTIGNTHSSLSTHTSRITGAGVAIIFSIAGTSSLGFVTRSPTQPYASASPDFVKLAEAYGAVGIRASKPNEVVPALEKAFAIPGPVLVDVMVDKDEFCFPMVPAGGANKDMLLERPSKDVKAKAAKSQTGF